MSPLSNHRPSRSSSSPPTIPDLLPQEVLEAVTSQDQEALLTVIAKRDRQIQEQVKHEVRGAIRRFVLPAFIIAGLGITGSLFWSWAQQRDREHDDCISAADTRDNFRTFAFGQQEQWQAVIDIFPPGGEELKKVQAIVDGNTAQIDNDFPVKDRSEC